MNNNIDPNINIVKRGTWLYGGVKKCEVRIVEHNIHYGTGDYSDPVDIRNDKEMKCYYIFYQTPSGEPSFTGGESAYTLEEAIQKVHNTLKTDICWL